ncbi:MAG: hypothetical protein ACPGRZ_06100 [Alphaproteobacteria bacterium]
MDAATKTDTENGLSWADRLQGTNINGTTLLATDYLNHFNEEIMLIEMVPDMPDIIEDVLAWEPKSYVQHFADSAFQDKDLAVEAYGYVPENLLAQFEALVACLNGNIFKMQQRLRDIDPAAPPVSLSEEIGVSIGKFHRLVEMISSVINGRTAGREIEPEKISAPPEGQSSTQDEIDALF